MNPRCEEAPLDGSRARPRKHLTDTSDRNEYDMKTSEVLNKAADLIEEHGWGTGTWSPSGPLCVEGAIAAAMGLNVTPMSAGPVYCPATAAVREYVGQPPFLWNDALLHNRVMDLIAAREGGVTVDQKQAVALAEGQAKVIATLRAVALIESAREQTRDHVVTTSPGHVRIVAARHDLELVEVDGYLLATLFVPALGEAIVYQAPVEVSA